MFDQIADQHQQVESLFQTFLFYFKIFQFLSDELDYVLKLIHIEGKCGQFRHLLDRHHFMLVADYVFHHLLSLRLLSQHFFSYLCHL